MHPVGWRSSQNFCWLDGTFNWIRDCLLDVNEFVKSCKAEVKLCKLLNVAVAGSLEGDLVKRRTLREAAVALAAVYFPPSCSAASCLAN
jgi:hypothetical protein